MMKIAVYDIVLDGEVIYVGITEHPHTREQNHKGSRLRSGILPNSKPEQE